jgi:uncharacterized protein (TIGR03435 family)
MINAVTNHLWQSTLFAVGVGLLTLAFRKNRAEGRYWLWFSASLKFLVPFSLLLNLGGFLGRTPAAKSLAVPAVTYMIVRMAEPFPQSPALVPSEATHRDWLPIALVSIWACGLGCIALIRLRGWLRIRAAVRSSIPVDMTFPVEVRYAPAALEPGIVGFFRPMLLFPAGIVDRLAPNQLQAVLAHELCHLRRRDNLTAAIHMLVGAVFWFHPLVWWISARLMEERERACDEGVLELGGDPKVYAESIVKTCQFCVESPLACVSGITGAELKQRIVRIMTQRVADKLGLGRRLTLMTIAIAVIAGPMVVGLVSGPQTRAQAVGEPAGPRPQFEVVSVKPNRSSDARYMILPSTGRFTATGVTTKQLITLAYNVKDFQVSGGPSWISSERYDIEAKEPDALAEEIARLPRDKNWERIGLMLQSLLADRFELRVRHETREAPVYALVIAKGGPKLLPAKSALPGPFAPGQPLPPQYPAGMTGATMQGPMSQVAAWLSRLPEIGRTVLDRTGLKGNYSIQLQWALDQGHVGIFKGPEDGKSGTDNAPPPESSGPSLFTALQEQLGLRLESARGPVETVIIDHIERPSEN